MKIIKSDKTGRNIHSPFVYRLIANVLFAPYPFYSFSEINLLAKNRKEKLQLQMIFRLVNHFQFDEVIFPGSPVKNIETVCKLAKSDIEINILKKQPKEIQKTDNEKYSRLIIVNDLKNTESVKLPESPEVWLCNKLSENNSEEYFNLLKTNQEVQITIELNQLGIAIFNKNFEKQNYVIKH